MVRMSIKTAFFPDCELGGLKDISDALKEDKSLQEDTLKQVSCSTRFVFLNLNMMHDLYIYAYHMLTIVTCGEKG